MILSYILLMIPPIYHIEDRTIDQAAHFTTILSFVSLIYSGSILHYLKGASQIPTTGLISSRRREENKRSEGNFILKTRSTFRRGAPRDEEH